jgi:high-affinity Fe2+/Pb2+ permease
VVAADIAKVVAVVAALVIGVVLSYGVLRLVGEQHKQNCIEEAQARFLAVGLTSSSIFKHPQGGPNAATLDDCKATIF